MTESNFNEKEHILTLQQGLQKFYADYGHQLSHQNEKVPQAVKSFFRAHDVAHVIFGCDISIVGEGSVKVWTIFGTSLGFWNHIREYKKASAFSLARNFSQRHLARNLFKLLMSIPRLMYRACRMSRPWPWSDYESYMDTPIAEIRREFNIHVL